MKFKQALNKFFLFWRKSPNQIFLDNTPRNSDGTYTWSYTAVIRQQRLSINSGLSAAVLAGIFLSVTILTWIPAETIEAVGSCAEDYIVELNSPLTNLTLCVGETFSMQGHWYDADDTGLCISNQTVKGLRDSTTITTSGGLTIASGTYQVNTGENSAGDHTAKAALTKTVTAAIAGTYTVKFTVTHSGLTVNYSSPSKTAMVKAQPGTPGSLSSTPASTTAINWSWADVANEENYQVRNTSNTNLSGALAANTISWQETSLSANASYTRRLYSYATVDSGACNATSPDSVGYTAIETPTNASLSNLTATSLDVTVNGSLTNLATGNSGVQITESVTSTNSGWIQTTGWSKTGLTPNTQYSFTAKARNQNSNETASTAAAPAYTLAAMPGMPTITAPTTTTADVVINQNGNPTGGGASADTKYAILETSTNTYVQAKGLLGAAAVWQTYSTWGAATGVTVSGLGSSTTYSFKAKARNFDGTETALSSAASVTTSSPAATITGPSAVTVNSETAKTGSNFNTIVSKTQLPTFSGKAEPNALITLTIYSDPLVFTTTSDATGNWSVTLDVPLPAGEHTLFISVSKNGQVAGAMEEAVFIVSSLSYLPIPTILTPIANQTLTDPTPTITGLARSGNTVRVYIDGELASSAVATTHATGTGSFAQTPTTPLAAGTHTLSVEAASGSSFSTRSAPFTFTINPPIIGSTILRLITQNDHAVIAGVGWGDTDARVYADGKEIDIFYIGGSGVQQFSRTLPSLATGTYAIKLRAEDNTDKLSNFSNTVYYTQNGGTQAPVVTTNAGTYTVQSGDSLWSIAERVYGDGRRYVVLITANTTAFPSLITNSRHIQPGWVLRIP